MFWKICQLYTLASDAHIYDIFDRVYRLLLKLNLKCNAIFYVTVSLLQCVHIK